MGFENQRRLLATMLAAAALMGGSSLTVAQDDMDIPEAPGSRVSGSISFDYYSHFISYGYDVWDGGRSWRNSTFNPSASINIAITDNMNLFTGAWADVNDDAGSSIGGDLQEVDVWLGIDYTIQEWTFSLTGQQWMYSGSVESIIDIGVAYDDSELWGDSGIVLSPSVTFHRTNRPQNGTDSGWAYVFGIAPGTSVGGDSIPVDLAFPVNLAFGDDDFYYDSGFAYFSFGAQASIPLSAIIDESYGAWSLNFGLTYYITDRDAIPQDALMAGDNPDGDFLVGNIGVSMAF